MSSGDYENRDVSIRPIFWAAAILVVSGALIHLLLWFMFDYYRQVNEGRDVRRSQIDTPAQPPPEPRLEINPTADFEDYVGRQKKELEGYGWVSRDQRRVRIPIRRAMELMVERETAPVAPTRTP